MICNSPSAINNSDNHYFYLFVVVLVIKSCPTLCDLWTVASQAPLFMEFPRQEYQSGLPFPSPGDFPTQGPSLHFLHWQADSLTLSHQGSPFTILSTIYEVPSSAYFHRWSHSVSYRAYQSPSLSTLFLKTFRSVQSLSPVQLFATP